MGSSHLNGNLTKLRIEFVTKPAYAGFICHENLNNSALARLCDTARCNFARGNS